MSQMRAALGGGNAPTNQAASSGHLIQEGVRGRHPNHLASIWSALWFVMIGLGILVGTEYIKESPVCTCSRIPKGQMLSSFFRILFQKLEKILFERTFAKLRIV